MTNGSWRAWNVGKVGIPMGAVMLLVERYTEVPPEVAIAIVAILMPVWAWFDKEYRDWKKLKTNK